MSSLARKSLIPVLRALRRHPAVATFDDRRYDRIEAAFLMPQGGGGHSFATSPFLFAQVIRESIRRRCNYRVIDLAHLNESDSRFLSENALDAEFIRGSKPQARIDDPESPAPSHANDAGPFDFQLDAIKSGGIAVVCPYSGRILRSDRSILAAEGNPIYYRFESRDVFYLAVGRPGIGYGKLYFFFPRLHTVVLLRDKCFWHGRDEIDRLRAHMIASHRDLVPYLRTGIPSVVCALIDCAHFAHHLWNALSGMDKVLSAGLVQHVSKVALSAEPFGPVDRILPALGNSSVERHRLPEFLRRSLRENWFLIRLGDNHISERLIRGVCEVADSVCSQKVKDEARNLEENHWPILWVTIRTGNRTWVSQCKGIPRLANDLFRQFPRLALIIDGFCIPYGGPAIDRREQDRAIREEMACVDTIRAQLNQFIPVRVNVGGTIPESVLFARIVDCYLAHHGSLQHKIGWIANCPGVVHSNADDLRGTYGKHRACLARNNAVAPTYLDPRAVTNAGGAVPKDDNRWHENMSSYDFDWRLARDEILKLLRDCRLRSPGQ